MLSSVSKVADKWIKGGKDDKPFFQAMKAGTLGGWWRRNVAGLKLNFVLSNSIFGPSVRLAQYDPKFLQYFGWIPINTLALTVFKSKHNSFVVISLTVYSAILLMSIQAHGDISETNEYVVLASEATTNVMVMVAFLLAGFVSKVVKEWREQRRTYATLIGKARNFSTQICAYIQAPRSKPELEEKAWNARRKFGRYIKLSMELGTMNGFELMDDNKCRVHLEAIGYLAPGEWEMLANGDRHTTVYMWMHWLIRECYEDGIIGEITAIMLSTSCSDIRDFANDINNFLFQEIPYPYAQVVTMLVKLLTVGIVTDFTLKAAVASTSPGQSADPNGGDMTLRIVFNIITLLISATLVATYQGLLDMHHILHSPFGPRALQVNHEGILYAGLGRTIDFMLGNPPPPPSTAHVKELKNATCRVVPHPNLTTDCDDVMGTPKVISTTEQ